MTWSAYPCSASSGLAASTAAARWGPAWRVDAWLASTPPGTRICARTPLPAGSRPGSRRTFPADTAPASRTPPSARSGDGSAIYPVILSNAGAPAGRDALFSRRTYVTGRVFYHMCHVGKWSVRFAMHYIWDKSHPRPSFNDVYHDQYYTVR